jgi:hypothetical protein
MELKYAIQCLDTVSSFKFTSRQKEAWDVVKSTISCEDNKFTSTNSDYAAALRVLHEFDATLKTIDEPDGVSTIIEWCEQHLK